MEEQFSVPPRCEHGECMMTDIASITLDVESGNSVSLVQHNCYGSRSACLEDVRID